MKVEIRINGKKIDDEDIFVINDPENLVGFVVYNHMKVEDWYVDDILEEIVDEGTVKAMYSSRFSLDEGTELWKTLERKYKENKKP